MRKIIIMLSLGLFFAVSSNVAHAQWDLRGCSQHGVSAWNPSSIESSLWTFRSNVWDGYIDFQKGGKYWTHWGYGTWKVNPDGTAVTLTNDYNDKSYEISFTDNGFQFQGIRNDGLIISGKLICSKYQGPGPQVPDKDAQKIRAFFKAGLEREPTEDELMGLYRLYVQGKTIDQITETIKGYPEYIEKQAARDEKLRRMEENGELQW